MSGPRLVCSHRTMPRYTPGHAVGPLRLTRCIADGLHTELWLAHADDMGGTAVATPVLLRLYRSLGSATTVVPISELRPATAAADDRDRDGMGRGTTSHATQFNAETAILAQLESVRGVLQPMQRNKTASPAWLAFAPANVTLQRALLKHAPLDYATVRPVLDAVAETLQHAHRLGIVHGHLRPGVMSRASRLDRWTIADFGLGEAATSLAYATARAAAGELSYELAAHLRAGSLTDAFETGRYLTDHDLAPDHAGVVQAVSDEQRAWLAPELWARDAQYAMGLALAPDECTPTPATDVYALGLIAAALMLGDHPASSGFFNGWERSGLTGPVADALRVATALHPSERYATVEELRAAWSREPHPVLVPCSVAESARIAAEAAGVTARATSADHTGGVASGAQLIRDDGGRDITRTRTRRLMQRMQPSSDEGALRGRITVLELSVLATLVVCFVIGVVVMSISSNQSNAREADRENLRALIKAAIDLRATPDAQWPDASGYQFWLSLYVSDDRKADARAPAVWTTLDGGDGERDDADHERDDSVRVLATPLTFDDADLLVSPADPEADLPGLRQLLQQAAARRADFTRLHCSFSGPSLRAIRELRGEASLTSLDDPLVIGPPATTIIGTTGARHGVGFLRDGFNAGYLNGRVEFLRYRDLAARWNDILWNDAVAPTWTDPHLAGVEPHAPITFAGPFGEVAE